MKKHSIKLIAVITLLVPALQAQTEVTKIDISHLDFQTLQQGLNQIRGVAQESIRPVLERIINDIQSGDFDALAQYGKDNVGQISSALGSATKFAIDKLPLLPDILNGILQQAKVSNREQIVASARQATEQVAKELKNIRGDINSENLNYAFDVIAEALKDFADSSLYEDLKTQLTATFKNEIEPTLNKLADANYATLTTAAQALREYPDGGNLQIRKVAPAFGVLRKDILPAVSELLTEISSLAIRIGNTVIESGYVAEQSATAQQRYAQFQQALETVANAANSLNNQLYQANAKINELLGQAMMKKVKVTVEKAITDVATIQSKKKTARTTKAAKGKKAKQAVQVDTIPDIGVD